MSTTCPTCGAELRDASINTYFRIATCHACHRVFNVTGVDGGWEGAPVVLERRRVGMPGNIRVLVDSESGPTESGYRQVPVESRFVIERRTPLDTAVFAGLLALGFDVISVIDLMAKPWTEGPLVFAAVLVFPLFALYLTYRALVAILNRTRITVASETLTISHSPIPTKGNRSLAASELSQLYCERVPEGRKTPETYSLIALTTAGGKIELFKGLEDAQQALYLEQVLENRLGIVDRPVDVEYHPEGVLWRFEEARQTGPSV